MDWAEADALLWLFVTLTLIRWGAKSLAAWLQAQGLLSDSVGKAVQTVLA